MTLKTVDVADNLDFVDKVHLYRLKRLQDFFPAMPEEMAEEIVFGAHYEMLQIAERLSRDGCPAELAYRILRP